MRSPLSRAPLPGAPLLGGALALVLAASAACGGDEPESANGLEKSTITVGTMPVGDTAPFQLAISKGLFKAEGLTVRPQNIAGGQEAIPKLKGGQLDISFGNYVSFFAASAKGTFKPKIVTDAFQSGPGTHVILVPKDSPIASAKDLAGRKIAVNTKRNISTLLVRAVARAQNVDLDEEKSFVEVPPPNMEAALKSGSVDAVQSIEPFGTRIQSALGARVLADTSQGPAKDLPIAGYAAAEEWAARNPKTVAAFQRAMAKAQAMAADRKLVQDTLPTYARGIDARTAASMKFGSYPTTLEAARLQRVADLMRQYGYLSTELDVQPLLAGGR